MRRRHVLALLLLGLLVGLSGCAQISIHTTVTADGEIAEYRAIVNTSTDAYGFAASQAEDQGYDSVEEWALDGREADEHEDIHYNERFDGDDVTINVTRTNLDPANSSTFTVEQSDGQLEFTDTRFVNESAVDDDNQFIEAVVVEYTVEMPGTITNSNADSVDGNQATWTETGFEAMNRNRIHAESNLPLFGIGLVPVIGLAALVVVVLAAGGTYWIVIRE